MDDSLKELFYLLGTTYKSPEDLSDVKKKCAGYESAEEIIVYLMKLYEILKLYHVEKFVSFELGLFESKEYYTGVVFYGFTYGTGEAIFSGGRYDDLISKFGFEAPAIGFVFVVDEILTALDKQNIKLPQNDRAQNMIYTEADREETIEKAEALRAEGVAVNLIRRDEEK